MAFLDKIKEEVAVEELEEAKSSYSRKSAASMKPKAKAASSVVLESERKPQTRAEKKAAKEAAKKKRANSQQSLRYEKPTSERYKRLRILWWVLIIAALVLMLIVAFAQTWFTETQNERIFYMLLFAGWGLLIAALILDFGPIRSERKRWEAEHAGAGKSKQERRAEKAKKAEENARRAKEYDAKK